MKEITRLRKRFETLPRLGKNKATQASLASAAGLTKSYVSEILNGKKNPTLAIVERLDAALDAAGAKQI